MFKTHVPEIIDFVGRNSEFGTREMEFWEKSFPLVFLRAWEESIVEIVLLKLCYGKREDILIYVIRIFRT